MHDKICSKYTYQNKLVMMSIELDQVPLLVRPGPVIHSSISEKILQ